jgi:hypothetical protein
LSSKERRIAKPLKDPNADAEKKREKLISLSREGLVKRHPHSSRKPTRKW